MSALSQFFQKRHKKNSLKQSNLTNQQIVSIFKKPFQKPTIKTQIKKKILISTQQQQSQDDHEQDYESQNLQENLQQQIQQQDLGNQKQTATLNKKIKKHKKIEKQKNKKKQKIKQKNTNRLQKQKQNQNKQQNSKIQINNNKLKIQQQPKQQQQQKFKSHQPQDLKSTIFVGNIPISSTHKQIKKHFQKYGKVLSVWFRSIPLQQSKIPKKGLYILKKYQQGADSMNAYIKFQNQHHSILACKQNGSSFNGNNIKVTKCTQQQIDYQTTIFIGNLPKNIKDQQLWNLFKSVGNVTSVRVIRNKDTLQGIGVAFVKFSTKQQMKNAILLKNNTQINGRIVRIKKAVNKQRIQKKIKNIQNKKFNKKNMKGQTTNYQHQKNASKSFKKKKIHKNKKFNKNATQNDNNNQNFKNQQSFINNKNHGGKQHHNNTSSPP